MKIKILGTRGEIDETAPWHTKHSGVLIDDHFLLDLGEEEYLDYNPSFIVFTHFHPDHAYFVRRKNELTENIKAYGPEENEEIGNVSIVNETFHVENYKFIPIPTIHSLKVKSQSYIIERKGKRILYTGDLAWMEKKYQEKLGDLDMVITEGSFFRKGGMIRRDKKSGKIFGHTGVPDLIRIFSKHTNHIVLMHFGKWFMKDVDASRKKIENEAPEGVKVEAARDGQEFEL
ncbi:MAG: MBL fold metallo-hydrolase [Bacteroidota bacterium]